MSHRPARAARKSSHRPVVRCPRMGRSAWLAAAEREAAAFLYHHGHGLADPSLAACVVERCAELAWEQRPGEPTWCRLRMDELWRRLAALDGFFPQPRLVLACDETLRGFLPWLRRRGALDAAAYAALLRELAEVSAPMLERARAKLKARAVCR